MGPRRPSASFRPKTIRMSSATRSSTPNRRKRHQRSDVSDTDRAATVADGAGGSAGGVLDLPLPHQHVFESAHYLTSRSRVGVKYDNLIKRLSAFTGALILCLTTCAWAQEP